MPTIIFTNGDSKYCPVVFKGQYGVEAVVNTGSGEIYSTTFIPYAQILRIEE